MTPAEVLKRQLGAGVTVRPGDNGKLILQAACEPPTELVDMARQHKAAVYRYLTEPRIDARTGDLVIPIDAPPEACWWKGGRSIADTLSHLGASEEVRARYSLLH